MADKVLAAFLSWRFSCVAFFNLFFLGSEFAGVFGFCCTLLTYDFGTILVFREMLSGTMEKLLYLAGGTPARTDDPLDDLETAEILFGLDLDCVLGVS